MKNKKYKVLTLEMFFDPKTSYFHNEITGNPDLLCKDLIEIMRILSESVKDSECKTMGEYFKITNK